MAEQVSRPRARAPLRRRPVDVHTPDFDDAMRKAAAVTRRALYRRLANDPTYLPEVRWQLPPERKR